MRARLPPTTLPPLPRPSAEVWAALLAFHTYLLLGPWLLYDALSGYPPAMLFHFGVLGRLPTAAGGAAAAAAAGEAAGAALPPHNFHSTCDTSFITLPHTLFCLIPATLWVSAQPRRAVRQGLSRAGR